MRRCEKCGARNEKPRWHRAEPAGYYSAQGRNAACETSAYLAKTVALDEHLHFFCSCGYEWATGVGPEPPGPDDE